MNGESPLLSGWMVAAATVLAVRLLLPVAPPKAVVTRLPVATRTPAALALPVHVAVDAHGAIVAWFLSMMVQVVRASAAPFDVATARATASTVVAVAVPERNWSSLRVAASAA